MLTAIILGISLPLAPCENWTDARAKYFEGHIHEAFQALDSCHSDPEAMRFYSDALWWQGDVEKSRSVANEIQERFNVDDDFQNHLTDRKSRLKFGALGGNVFGENGSYQEFSTYLQWRYFSKNTLTASFERDARALADGRQLADNRIGLDHSLILNRWSYLNTHIAVSPDDEFLPRMNIQVDPRFTLRDVDFGLGFEYAYYRRVKDSILLKPSLQKFLTDRLLVTAGSSLVLRPMFVASGYGDIFYRWPRFVQTGIRGGAGESYEGDGIKDSFWTLGVRASSQLSPRLKLNLSCDRYSSDLRDEWRITGGFDVLL